MNTFLATIDWRLAFLSAGFIGLPLVLWRIHVADRRASSVLPPPSVDCKR